MVKERTKKMVRNYRNLAFSQLKKICVECIERRNLEVHHKDGNIHNNLLSNLELRCNEHHNKIHGTRKPRKKLNKKVQPGTRHGRRKKQ